MKKYNGSYFEALSMTGNSKLDLLPYDRINVETVKKAIDRINKKVIAEGWIDKPEQYIIARHTWENVFDDNGSFVSTTSKSEARLIYPEIV